MQYSQYRCFCKRLWLAALLCINTHTGHYTAVAQKDKLPGIAALREQATHQQKNGDIVAARQTLELALRQAQKDKHADECELELELGQLWQRTEQAAQANLHYEAARRVAVERGRRDCEANALSYLGAVTQAQGRTREALRHYQAALTLYRALNDEISEANLLNNIGTVYNDLGEPYQALGYLQQSLAMRGDDPARREMPLLNIALSYRSLRNQGKAMEAATEVLKLRTARGDKAGQADIHFLISTLQSETNELYQAASSALKALQLHHAIANLGGEMLLLERLAAIESYGNHNEAALKYLRQALELAEGPREALLIRESEWADTVDGIYPLMVRLLLAQNQPTEAFLWSERYRAQWRRNDLRRSGITITKGLSSEEIRRENELVGQVAVKAAQMRDEATQGKRPPDEARRIVIAAADELEQYRDQLYDKYPQLALARAARPVSLSDVARRLPDDTALLEFAPAIFTGETRPVLFCITVNAGQPQLTTHNVVTTGFAFTRTPLSALCNDFRTACFDVKREPDFTARSLFEILFGATAPHFAKKKRLLISPTAYLWSVPFAALVNGNDEYLAQRHEIAFTQSATTALAALGTQRPSKAPANLQFFADNAPLAAILRAAFPNATARPTTAKSFQEFANKSAVLHLALPSRVADDSLPELAFPDQSVLAERQLLPLSLPAPLVITAPVSGQSEFALRLYPAWQTAGVPALLTSHTAVPAHRAALFWKPFYARLRQGRPLGAAWRGTAMELIKNPATAHPAFWSSYAVFGNWEWSLTSQ